MPRRDRHAAAKLAYQAAAWPRLFGQWPETQISKLSTSGDSSINIRRAGVAALSITTPLAAHKWLAVAGGVGVIKLTSVRPGAAAQACAALGLGIDASADLSACKSAPTQSLVIAGLLRQASAGPSASGAGRGDQNLRGSWRPGSAEMWPVARLKLSPSQCRSRALVAAVLEMTPAYAPSRGMGAAPGLEINGGPTILNLAATIFDGSEAATCGAKYANGNQRRAAAAGQP